MQFTMSCDVVVFFLNDAATTEISTYCHTLSLRDALPILACRRAMKRAGQSAMRPGAEGIRINCAGRLGGAEIARTEWYREGRVPLHTLRANVDYAESNDRKSVA